MISPTLISDASVKDLDIICEIERECFPQDAFDKLTYVSLLLSPDVIFLKYCVDSEIAGFIVGMIRRVKGNLECVISTVNVRSRFRRRGIATALVRMLEKRLIAKHCFQVVLQVGLDNLASLRLFSNLCYRRLHVLRDYYASGRHAMKMGKTLKYRPENKNI